MESGFSVNAVELFGTEGRVGVEFRAEVDVSLALPYEFASGGGCYAESEVLCLD